MTLRSLRILVVLAVTALTSGIPQIVAGGIDDDCCTESCEGLEGTPCPPNCTSALCAKVQASLGAVLAPCLGPRPTSVHSVVVVQASPELPLVITGVFHPPRA